MLLPKRQAHIGNRALRDILNDQNDSAILSDETGRIRERTAIFVSADQLEGWLALVARGVAFFH